MFVLFVLLISISAAYADEPSVSTSGYIFNTSFSDNTFHSNRTIAALNVDADYQQFAARAQASTGDLTVRRAVLEYSFPIGSDVETIVQHGRFGRIDSLFSSLLDSPSSLQMAIPPMGGYSYRMYNGSFTLMDGTQSIFKLKTKDALLGLRLAYGKPVINSQEFLQKEAFGRYDTEIKVNEENGNYDVALSCDTRQWKTYIARNRYLVSVSSDSKSLTKQGLAKKYRNVEYVIDRAGVEYDNQALLVRAEITRGTTETFSALGTTSHTESQDYNLVLGHRIYDSLVYLGTSRGKNRTDGRTNEDFFIGTTHNIESFTVSLEYHVGYGKSWMKYDTTDSDGRWSSAILSTTYRF